MSTEPATVTLTVGSTPYTLRPTVDHMRVLNRLQGGFLALFRSVGNLEGDTMALVIAAGAGVRGKPVEDLTRAVYESGLEDLVDPLTRFLTLCCNGGRDPAAAQAKAAGAVEPVDGDGPEKVAADREPPAGAQLLDAVQEADRRFGTGTGTAGADALTSRESTAA